MENIKLAVIVSDRDYGRALSLALVEVYRNFTVTLYKSVPIHNELLRFDLVLQETQAAEEIQENVIGLVEKPSMADQDLENRRFFVYKYGNVRQLAGQLLFIYSFLTGRQAIPIKNQDVKLVVFGQVQGGAGCTSAAMAFAHELKRFRGKRVLYVSLEEIESTLEYMEAFPEGKSINEYLYYLFHEKEQGRIPFIESFLVFDRYGIDSFQPSPGRNVLRSLDDEEIQYFISSVMDTGRYDFVIADVGMGLDKSALCCYEMANNICLVACGHGEASRYKETRFLEYLTFLKGECILDKMGKILNRYDAEMFETDEQQRQTEEGGMLRVVCRLKDDPESFTEEDGFRYVLPDGAYGQGIKELADSVLNNMM